MAYTILVEVKPMRPLDASIATFHLAGGGSVGKPYTGLLGIDDWRSGIRTQLLYNTQIGFSETGWDGGARPKTADIEFASSDPTLMEKLATYYFNGADITIWEGDDAAGTIAAALTGKVADHGFKGGVLSMTLADMAESLSKPIAPDQFGGGGGIDGGTYAVGRIKRRSWGRVFDIECRLLDLANNIYEVGDPSRPLQDIYEVRDKGVVGPPALLPWQGSIAATFAALQAAVPPSGGATVAPSIACLKWWTQPAGPLTCHVLGEIGAGYIERVADIAGRIGDDEGGLSTNSYAVEPFYTSRVWPAGIHCDSATETIAQVLDRLLNGAGMTWIVETDATITLRDFTWDNPVAPVRTTDVARTKVLAPAGTRTLIYARNNHVFGDGDISPSVDAGTAAYFKSAGLKAIAAASGAAAYGDRIVNSEVISPYAVAGDAAAEVQRQASFLNGMLAVDQVTVPGRRRDLIGRLIWATGDRLGYSKPGTVLNRNGTSVVDGNALGTVITKTAATAAWDSSAISYEGHAPGGYVSFRPAQTNKTFMLGLNSDVLADDAYASLDHAWYLFGGLLYIYENGSQYGPFGAYAAGDLLEIRRDIFTGDTTYYHNFAPVRTSTITGLPLYLDSSFLDSGAVAHNVVFGSQESAVFVIGANEQDIPGSTVLTVLKRI